eukprot:2941266-Pleurochrysis_carterae.AAC.1
MNSCHGNSLGAIRNFMFAVSESLEGENEMFLLMKLVQHRFHQRKLSETLPRKKPSRERPSNGRTQECSSSSAQP